MSSTTLMLQRSAKQFRFYSPMALRGTLWVCSGVLVMTLKTLMEWKTAGTVTAMDYKIFWVSVAAVAVDKCLTYMDTTFARFRDEKKKRDETEAIARTARTTGEDPEGHLR